MPATHPGFSGKIRMYDVLVLPHPPTNTTVHLPLDVVISSVHKMMRRALSAELAHLVRSFFAAMQASYGDKPTQAMMAACTKVVNRFAIALIEEGILVNMRKTSREFSIVLDSVCDMNAAKEAAKWDECARCMERILRATAASPRHRYISCLKALAESGDARAENLPDLLNNEELEHIKAKNLKATRDLVTQAVRLKVPQLRRLTEVKAFMNCGEFRRVLYMLAQCWKLLERDLPFAVHAAPTAAFFPVPFSHDDLVSWGVFDQHTAAGKRSRDGGKQVLGSFVCRALLGFLDQLR